MVFQMCGFVCRLDGSRRPPLWKEQTKHPASCHIFLDAQGQVRAGEEQTGSLTPRRHVRHTSGTRAAVTMAPCGDPASSAEGAVGVEPTRSSPHRGLGPAPSRVGESRGPRGLGTGQPLSGAGIRGGTATERDFIPWPLHPGPAREAPGWPGRPRVRCLRGPQSTRGECP